jgi:thiol-disulfide isomerase/thioredoxin
MMKRLLILVILTGFICCPAFAAGEVAVKPAAPLKGLEWVKGSAVNSFQEGHVYVVEFWATWCPPCKKSIPHLTKLQEQYKDKKVTIIGISNEPVKTIKPFVEKMGDQMAYTVASDAKQLTHTHYMQAYGVRGIPHAFIVDGKGKLVWQGNPSYPVGEMDTVLGLVAGGGFDPVAYAKKKAEEEAKMKKLQQLYGEYFQKLQADGPGVETRLIAAEFMKVAPVDALNAMAWDILTRIEKNKRDLETALTAAAKSNEMTEGKDPTALDTYALALFESGKIEDAIKAQQKAVDLLPEDVPPQAKKHFNDALNKYKAAKK